MTTNNDQDKHRDHGITREELHGTWGMERQAELSGEKARERAEQAKLDGLEAASSIVDRSLTLFRREPWTMGGGSTFMQAPFLQDMRQLGGQDVAIVGAPLDTGTTYRPGTRFGPDAIRRISALGYGYNPERGIDLRESLYMADVGDIQVIPANIEKSFDQIALAIGYITERSVFPVVLGGDHSIGYPDIRGAAPYIDGNIGIIHFDRHSDLREKTYDERMRQILTALTDGFTDDAINIVAAHCMVTGAQLGGGERASQTYMDYWIGAQAFPPNAHYVALGHLHRTQRIAGAAL